MKVLILSDIHGNLTAMRAVLKDIEPRNIDRIILLGDIIDYGPHSNEVVELLEKISIPVICNIWGNHENAIINEDYESFSTERGKQSAQYTHDHLTVETREYVQRQMAETGKMELEICGKKCLAIHGSLRDEFWRAILPEDSLEDYQVYDYVFSGHSHLPHFFSRYYKTENSVTRNKKKTVFINPGSVGQPRNLNPRAQYAIWDTESEEVLMASVEYDVKVEQNAFSAVIDTFYRTRLEMGV